MSEKGLTLAHTIVNTLDEKKGEQILLLDIEEHCSFTDYFIICTAISDRTIKALANEVQKAVKETHSLKVWGVEGDPDGGWILMDYGDVILHLFGKETREYYQLEELWGAGQVLISIS